MSGFRTTAAAVTHEGLVREQNEDSYLVADQGLWAVADGMGGHKNGRWASQTLIAHLAAVELTGQYETDAGRVAAAVHAANEAIFAEGAKSEGAMGSTVAAVYVGGDQFAAFWAGDSRIYLRRGGELYRLTRDHTHVQDLVARGVLSETEAQGHAMGHVLSRAVGVERALELDAVTDTIEARDCFLICSDGVTGVVSDAEIEAALTGPSLKSAVQSLLDLVLSRGAPDNATAIAVLCEEATKLVTPSDLAIVTGRSDGQP